MSLQITAWSWNCPPHTHKESSLRQLIKRGVVISAGQCSFAPNCLAICSWSEAKGFVLQTVISRMLRSIKSRSSSDPNLISLTIVTWSREKPLWTASHSSGPEESAVKLSQPAQGRCTGAGPGFWSGGHSGVLTPGGPEPKICSK